MVARTIQVGEPRKLSTLELDSEVLKVSSFGKKPWSIPVRQVLWAELTRDGLHLDVLARKQPGAPLDLVHISGKCQRYDEHPTETRVWAAALMKAAYEDAGVKRCRRLRVLVNPKGGKGKARRIYASAVEPVFKAARCKVDVTYTEYAKHGIELARAMPLGAYDALVIASGDGLLHECINGLATHTVSPRKALKIPLAPIPTGSANGTSINLLGVKEGFDVRLAALNAIKSSPMPLDLFEVSQGGKSTYSFMSQCVGLMADLDLGTEHMRWMGDTRFIVGYVRGLLRFKPCPVTLSIRVEERDKEKLLSAHRDTLQNGNGAHAWAATVDSDPQPPVPESDHEPAPLPTSKFASDPARWKEDQDGWTTFDRPLLYMYAGQCPYVSRDLMQFPLARPDDGMVDVVVQEMTSRGELLKAMDGADQGKTFFMPTQHYFKASAYRVAPAAGGKGCLSIDGEGYPFEPFQLEVHKGLATVLSPTGRYAHKFDADGAKKGKRKEAN